MDPLGYGRDQIAQELTRGGSARFRLQTNDGEVRRPLDGHEHVQLALVGSDFGDVDVEITDRITLELASGLSLPFQIGQAEDAMTLIEPMQARPGQVRDRVLQRGEAVIERRRSVPENGDAGGFLFRRKAGRAGLRWPRGRILEALA